MEDILDVIKQRRNVEQFIAKPVSWDKISKIVDAARHAPSSGNLQNWKFVVVQDSENKQTLAKHCYDQLDIIAAAALIIVCGEPEKAERYYGLRGSKLYTVQNCAAAIQNMLLEATSLGLASRWIGAFEEDKVKASFGIPKEVRPQAVIAIGHPKFIPKKPSKYPLETLVYLNKWRGKINDMDAVLGNKSAILARNVKGFVDPLKSGIDHVKDTVKEKAEPVAKSFLDKIKDKLKKK